MQPITAPQYTVQPLSATTIDPFSVADMSETRNSATFAMSFGLAGCGIAGKVFCITFIPVSLGLSDPNPIEVVTVP